MSKHDYIKVPVNILVNISRETNIKYEELYELYVGSAKWCGRDMQCMVLSLVNRIVKLAIEYNIKLNIVFYMQTGYRLPSDPGYVAEIYKLKVIQKKMVQNYNQIN